MCVLFLACFLGKCFEQCFEIMARKIVAQIIGLLLVAAVNHDKVCCRSELKGDLRQVSVAE